MNILTNNYIAIAITLIATVVMILAYIKSPTQKDKTNLSPIFISIEISAVTIWFTKGYWDFIIAIDPTSIYRLAIIPLIILSYCTVSLIFISFTAWKKGGFSKLKKFSERGLIWGSIFGLITGLSSGLVFGLIVGLINGLSSGLSSGFISGLALGLSSGLAFGLTSEFDEFKNHPITKS
jgi:hypothetical protein